MLPSGFFYDHYFIFHLKKEGNCRLKKVVVGGVLCVFVGVGSI